jgi:hypothetical protein
MGPVPGCLPSLALQRAPELRETPARSSGPLAACSKLVAYRMVTVAKSATWPSVTRVLRLPGLASNLPAFNASGALTEPQRHGRPLPALALAQLADRSSCDGRTGWRGICQSR